MEIEGGSKFLFQQVFALRGRISELAAGLAAMKLLNFSFDYLLYPFTIYQFGVLRGGLLMMVLSFVACLLLFRFYDWSRRDWLGIETIKTLKTYEGNRWIRRMTSWILRKSKPVVFIFLSIKFDAFITMIYFRHGAFNGMNKRDWQTFTGSIVVGNFYWTLACYLGVSLFAYAIKLSHDWLHQ